jgi:rhodanese-related sulfurtransferase
VVKYQKQEGKTMKTRISLMTCIVFLLAVILLTACGHDAEKEEETVNMYRNITAAEAKEIMDSEEGYIILDVRSQEEYDESHIPGAIVIPHTEIEAKAESVLTDKGQLILVYCRSGRRSKLAAEALVALGYTNIVEFGGIIDWSYEVE